LTNQKQEWPVVAMIVNGSGRHRQFFFLIGRFLKIITSETTLLNEPKLGRKHRWKVLYKDCRIIWLSGFRGEDLLEINQSETRIVCGGHAC
jgi:hypothetical protein